MTEEDYFQYFELNQLHSVDFNTGCVDVIMLTNNQYGNKSSYIRKDIGSFNEDGYQRVWCGSTTDPLFKPKLFMKHRLLYWLKHKSLGTLKEVDHIDRNRANNSTNNLRLCTKKQNMTNINVSKVKSYTYPESVILHVCHLLETTDLSDLVIADKVGISRNYVRDIKKRRRRAKLSKPFTWVHRE